MQQLQERERERKGVCIAFVIYVLVNLRIFQVLEQFSVIISIEIIKKAITITKNAHSNNFLSLCIFSYNHFLFLTLHA